jgi:pimeloyl-ACP methyl ester carboxylesterase
MISTRTLLISAVLVGFGCDAARKEMPRAPAERTDDRPTVAPPTAAVPSAAAAPQATTTPPPAHVEQLAVAGDLPVSIVRSLDGRPPRIVFFPGLCSNAGAYLHGFAGAARAHGGAIAIDGDRPCGNQKDFHSITSDPAHEEPRIRAALAAAGASDQADDLVWVGYSLGATLIENLAKKAPERYRRVVLIGSPKDPRRDRLEKARAVATMSCSLDVPGRMKRASQMLTGIGVTSSYFEMPGCTHGNLAEGERVFDEVFAWIGAR